MSKVQLVVNDGLIPRFTASGRHIEPGEVFDASELHTADFIAKSTPVGNLTDEQLLALVAKRGLVANPGAPEGEPGAAPVAPFADPAILDALDEQRAEQLDAIAGDLGGDIRPASEVLAEQGNESADDARDAAQAARDKELNRANSDANLDRDKDGKPGGSLTKAEIAAQLTDLGVAFDPNAKRDDLGRLLDNALAA